LKTTVLVHRLVRKARGELKKKFQERVEKALEGVEEAAEPDGQLLEKFMGRQKTYCDLCQGFSQEELASALCKWELRPYSFAAAGRMPPGCPSLLSPSIPLE